MVESLFNKAVGLWMFCFIKRPQNECFLVWTLQNSFLSSITIIENLDFCDKYKKFILRLCLKSYFPMKKISSQLALEKFFHYICLIANHPWNLLILRLDQQSSKSIRDAFFYLLFILPLDMLSSWNVGNIRKFVFQALQVPPSNMRKNIRAF